jgi:hypothetical protein
MPSKATSEALNKEWRQHIDTWRASQESQQAFCKQHDLNYHRFTYWRRKFQDQAHRENPRRSSALVPVTYLPAPEESGLSLHLSNGMRLSGITSDNLLVVQQLLSRLS